MSTPTATNGVAIGTGGGRWGSGCGSMGGGRSGTGGGCGCTGGLAAEKKIKKIGMCLPILLSVPLQSFPQKGWTTSKHSDSVHAYCAHVCYPQYSKQACWLVYVLPLLSFSLAIFLLSSSSMRTLSACSSCSYTTLCCSLNLITTNTIIESQLFYLLIIKCE